MKIKSATTIFFYRSGVFGLFLIAQLALLNTIFPPSINAQVWNLQRAGDGTLNFYYGSDSSATNRTMQLNPGNKFIYARAFRDIDVNNGGDLFIDPSGQSVMNALLLAGSLQVNGPIGLTGDITLGGSINKGGYFVNPNGNNRLANGYFDKTLINWPGYNGITQAYGHHIFPGRNDGSGGDWQQNWYLASHSSYGLYTNAGMYFQGQIFAPSWSDLNNGVYSVDPNGYSQFFAARRTFGFYGPEWDENGGDYKIDPGDESKFNYFWVRYFRDADNGNYFVDLDNTSWFNTLNAYAGNTVSDIKIKKDITPLQDSLNRVLKLRGVNYYNRQDTESGNLPEGKQVGLIAQEVESIIPEIVTTNENGYKSIEYGKLNSVLIEAIKEQQTQIDTLKTTTAQQGKEIEQLKKAIEALKK